MPFSPVGGPYVYTPSLEITASDAVQTFATDYSDYITRVPAGGGSQEAQYALIQVRDNGLAWLSHEDPDQAGFGYDAPAGTPIVLAGKDAILGFRFINATNGDDARLIVTFGF